MGRLGFLSCLSLAFSAKEFTLMKQYVNQVSLKYQIDKSHNIVHSMDVLKYTRSIIQAHPTDTMALRELEACAFLHDCVDDKYRPCLETAHKELEDFLTTSLHFSDEQARFVLLIINTMSHSKTIKDGKFKQPLWILDAWTPNKYIYIYHIVRQADLLASYDIERMLCYKFHKLYCHNVDAVIEDTIHTYENRILPLRKIPHVFPSYWAREESARLEMKSGEMLAKLVKDHKDGLVVPDSFEKYRIL